MDLRAPDQGGGLQHLRQHGGEEGDRQGGHSGAGEPHPVHRHRRKDHLQDRHGAGRRSGVPAAGGRHLHQRHGDPADLAAGEYSGLGAAADHLHRAGADAVPQSHEENGRRKLHDVQYGQVQRQGLRQVRRGHQV